MLKGWISWRQSNLLTQLVTLAFGLFLGYGLSRLPKQGRVLEGLLMALVFTWSLLLIGNPLYDYPGIFSVGYLLEYSLFRAGKAYG